jgi:hypothetical protein
MTSKYKVIGRFEIAGAKPGEEVELDPAKTNIKALVKARLVEAVPDKPKAESDKPKPNKA